MVCTTLSSSVRVAVTSKKTIDTPSRPFSASTSGLTWISNHTVSAPGRCHLTSWMRGRAALHLGLLQIGAQFDRPVGHLQIAQQPADVAGREAEHGFGLLVDHRDGVVAGHHDLGDRAGAESQVAHGGQAGQIAVAVVHAPRPGRSAPAPSWDPAALRKTAVLEVQRGEPVAVAQQHLGVPEEQHALRRQRKMQAAQHISLRLGVEVHQGVAAHQQVDPRDRRVLDQVVAAEDHRPAQVLVKYVAAVDLLEVPRQQVRRHRLDGLGVVGGGARLGERLLVDVGARRS